MTPLDLATDGYLHDPLCMATNGYICITVLVSGRGRSGLSKRQKLLRREMLDDEALMRQLVREDEELISLMISAVNLF